jgi:four helix bundle protein
MTKEELKKRTKQFALRVMKMVEKLPNTKAADVLARQILRSATSVAANYRSACKARSTADFISKITVVEEEADETLLWLELISESGMIEVVLLKPLLDEANELTAIFTATGKTARNNHKPATKQNPKSDIRNPK